MANPRKFRQRLLDALKRDVQYNLKLTHEMNFLSREDILSKIDLPPHGKYIVEDKIKYYYQDNSFYIVMKLYSNLDNNTYSVLVEVDTRLNSITHHRYLNSSSIYDNFGNSP